MTDPASAVPADAPHPPAAPLSAVLVVTVLGSISSGTFWAGLFFVTAQKYGFSVLANLILATVMGAVYTIAARVAGRLAHGRVPRRVMSLALGTWTAAALLPLLVPGAVSALWIAALVGSAASATTFPVVESYLTAGRHGAEMRSAIGKFNLTWTPATALPLLLLPLFGREGKGAAGSFAISAAASALALLAARALPLHPAPHGKEAAEAAVGVEYPSLLRAASWLLPFSYVISATLAPVLPHRLAAVGVGGSASFIAAIWMATRFVALLVMWRSSFWHGRWGTIGAASAALVGGLALVLLATSLPILIAGLLVYGAGMGLTYYLSLYYSMAIGQGAVDAGGNFEALIGVGYCLGPLLGIVGRILAGPARGDAATVALTWLCTAFAARGVVRPYLQARRRR
ncbi:MAG TPA: hypothetical protein VLC06_07615 [Polyangia bacterium]|nr:hypothetical protein [Polyangia bacterium]